MVVDQHELGTVDEVVETMVPRRLDGLPWSRWHWLVVIEEDPDHVPGMHPWS